MSEYAYVIMRDDGWFCSNGMHFTEKLALADVFEYESMALSNICFYDLHNCKPVKIKIEIVGEEE